MLEITIFSDERWDESKECFLPPIIRSVLKLEHSLLSISKWESRWHKPYLIDTPKTLEENLSYIECMVLNKDFDPTILFALSDDNLEKIGNYINDPMTATTINTPKTASGRKEIVTSELLYYYMTAFNIPMECQKWHLNRLMTLIQVCNAKQQTETPMSKQDVASRNAALNAARRKQYGSNG